MDRDQRMHLLLRELDRLDVRLRLDSGHLRVQHGDRLTAELCDEILELRTELTEYLSTIAEEVVDDPEERSHQGNNTPPAPEMSRSDKLRAGLPASKRTYM